MKQIINDFINSIDTKLYRRIRESKGDAECRRYLKEHLQNQCDIHAVLGSKPHRKSLRLIIEERRTNLCLTAKILEKDGKNSIFFVSKYELLDNILNEFDGIEELY